MLLLGPLWADVHAILTVQRLNHFMGMMELCRKKCLSRNMTTMAACFPKLYNFTPQTFNLPQAMDKALCALKGGRKTFILKPDGGSQVLLQQQSLLGTHCSEQYWHLVLTSSADKRSGSHTHLTCAEGMLTCLQGKGIRLVQTPEQLRASLEDMPTCEIVMSKCAPQPMHSMLQQTSQGPVTVFRKYTCIRMWGSAIRGFGSDPDRAVCSALQ